MLSQFCGDAWNAQPRSGRSESMPLIGCTQATEILFTEGVDLVAPLPKEFELATVYTAAVCTKAGQPQAARELIAMLASAEFSALRQDCGFEA